ncbi:hypothetical protein Pcaca03_30720 [Pectobacterium carotovorum subsp. carotovorum]|uniref:RHS repeat-associated core domain-containing protein n=1 Tax=Pectobacterium carotovorum subsp. carotovorum TaxID=555 RepID=A0AAI9L0D5_PECCC|nr:hypothetical protein SOASR016_29360 [Pectobacterium carotovorum subsp. carotovorum]GLV70628.1 hypothetical protein Pcaca03_30720 [Pectobacterium carotovorum subsp. carotovorum]
MQILKSTLWGQRPSSTEDPADPSLAFAGQYRDTKSGLCYNRFRYYDPTGGCYVSPDPIGVLGGESNYGMFRIRLGGLVVIYYSVKKGLVIRLGMLVLMRLTIFEDEVSMTLLVI